jgi:hypothetical protein
MIQAEGSDDKRESSRTVTSERNSQKLQSVKETESWNSIRKVTSRINSELAVDNRTSTLATTPFKLDQFGLFLSTEMTPFNSGLIDLSELTNKLIQNTRHCHYSNK